MIFDIFSCLVGLLIGFVVALWLCKKKKSIRKIGMNESVELVEKLISDYQSSSIEGIKKFERKYEEEKKIRFIIDKKDGPSAYQLWAAIILYMSYKYASYDFGDKNSDELSDIVSHLFGNQSIGYKKYQAANEILNRSTKYYVNDNWIRLKKQQHGTFSDFADESLYDMMYMIITSSFESTISFDEDDDEVEESKSGEKLFFLGMMNEKQGQTAEALRYFEESALAGYAQAQLKMGILYAGGEVVPRDAKISFDWFLQAAENGNSIGQFFAGRRLIEGVGTTKNLNAGIQWLNKSIEQGWQQAEDYLGTLYVAGEIIDRDYIKAFDLLSRAARHGSAHAAQMLSYMYVWGDGVEKNATQALYWIDEAIKLDPQYESQRSKIENAFK